MRPVDLPRVRLEQASESGIEGHSARLYRRRPVAPAGSDWGRMRGHVDSREPQRPRSRRRGRSGDGRRAGPGAAGVRAARARAPASPSTRRGRGRRGAPARRAGARGRGGAGGRGRRRPAAARRRARRARDSRAHARAARRAGSRLGRGLGPHALFDGLALRLPRGRAEPAVLALGVSSGRAAAPDGDPVRDEPPSPRLGRGALAGRRRAAPPAVALPRGRGPTPAARPPRAGRLRTRPRRAAVGGSGR